jgi:hypothetical protein
MEGQEPQTQFERAVSLLGVELILGHSPQAKRRVERRNSLLQDRLVKALRLRSIQRSGRSQEPAPQRVVIELQPVFPP